MAIGIKNARAETLARLIDTSALLAVLPQTSLAP